MPDMHSAHIYVQITSQGPFDNWSALINVLGMLFVHAVLDFCIISCVFLQTSHSFVYKDTLQGLDKTVTWFYPFNIFSMEDITIYKNPTN